MKKVLIFDTDPSNSRFQSLCLDILGHSASVVSMSSDIGEHLALNPDSELLILNLGSDFKEKTELLENLTLLSSKILVTVEEVTIEDLIFLRAHPKIDFVALRPLHEKSFMSQCELALEEYK